MDRLGVDKKGSRGATEEAVLNLFHCQAWGGILYAETCLEITLEGRKRHMWDRKKVGYGREDAIEKKVLMWSRRLQRLKAFYGHYQPETRPFQSHIDWSLVLADAKMQVWLELGTFSEGQFPNRNSLTAFRHQLCQLLRKCGLRFWETRMRLQIVAWQRMAALDQGSQLLSHEQFWIFELFWR